MSDEVRSVSVEPEPEFLMALQIATDLKEQGIVGARLVQEEDTFPAEQDVALEEMDVATLAVAIEPILRKYGAWFASKVGK